MKERRDRRPYVGLLKEDINSKEYADLSLRAKGLYTLLKMKFNPDKNSGLVRLSYREVRERKWRGLLAWNIISETFQELESKGWIERAERGGLFGNTTLYRLTRHFDKFRIRSGE